MERGPLPPHERAWRHPSELAALESARLRADPGGRALRTAAMVSGTLGLVLIGALAVMVTPRQQNGPLAVGTSPSFVDPTGLAPVTSALLEIAVSELTSAFAPARELDRTSRDTSPAHATTTVARTTVAPPATEALVVTALATPLESGVAIVTTRSIDGRAAGDQIEVRLASGITVDAQVVATFGHAAFVTLGSVPADEPERDVATSLPGHDDLVTVLLSPPRSVRLAELAGVGAPEGTAVVDAEGRLVGLCTEGADGSMGLAVVDPDADADGLVASSTSPPASSSPATDPAPSSAPATPSTAPGSAPPGTTAGSTVSTVAGGARHG